MAIPRVGRILIGERDPSRRDIGAYRRAGIGHVRRVELPSQHVDAVGAGRVCHHASPPLSFDPDFFGFSEFTMEFSKAPARMLIHA